jgi:hypothetical protein
MELPPEDFESSASTNFTTPARCESYTNVNLLSSENRLKIVTMFWEFIREAWQRGG